MLFSWFSVLEITGYVNNISTERKGKTGKFFECQIKVGENNYKKIYVWKPEKRTDFLEIQNKKRAIHLYSLTERGKFLNFNEHSSYEETSNPSYEADKETIEESAVRTIASLDKVPTEQIISLKAKVVTIYDVQLVTVRGSPINNRELEIADETAKIKLVLWGDQCYDVKRDKTYFFRKFRLRRTNKETYVNTPQNSALSSIGETKDFAEKDGIKGSFVDILCGCFPMNFVKPFRTTIF